MITIKAQQHILSSVERGYFPQHGRGFQTVALSKELIGTRDLHTLERASFYALSRSHRQQNRLPVKDTFFALPSGRYAVGRTIDFGADSMGREGNFLTHHLIIESEDLTSINVNPFVIFDTVFPDSQNIDLTPRDLPLIEINLSQVSLDYRPLEEISEQMRSALAAATADSTERRVLLVAEEDRSKSLLRALFAVLATEERSRLTFSTHFFESHDLRQLFNVAAVHLREDVPSQAQDYLIFDFTSSDFSAFAPSSDYGIWLSECVRDKKWEEIRSLNRLIDQLRSQADETEKLIPVASKQACAALWERAGTKTARVLVGNLQLTITYLKTVPSPRLLADALLESASPSQICGSDDLSDESAQCLSLLQSFATGRVWREWVQQWREDLALGNIKREARPWWKLWT